MWLYRAILILWNNNKSIEDQIFDEIHGTELFGKHRTSASQLHKLAPAQGMCISRLLFEVESEVAHGLYAAINGRRIARRRGTCTCVHGSPN